MKILCETQVISRQNTSNQHGNRVRALKATVAVGFHPSTSTKKMSELQILHFTPQCRTGVKYKVKDNIQKIYTKFINDGKATISFKNPEQDLMIKCDPIVLKGFLRTLKLGLDGKNSLNLNLNSTTAIPVKNHPILKLNVRSRAQYPTKGFPKSLKEVSINGLTLCKLSFEICSLRNLTSLNMSDNVIKSIPVELGRLSLVEVNFATNLIGKGNNWRWLSGTAIQKSLRVLDLSDNHMKHFPSEIVKLPNLVTLKLNNNTIRYIPFAIRRMANLRFLHMCTNKLQSLPSTLNHLRLDTLDVWGNHFQERAEIILENGPLSRDSALPLLLIAARAVAHHKLPYTEKTIPSTLVDLMSESPVCLCGQLCFYVNVLKRAMVASLVNVTHLTFSRNRVIYSDVIICNMKCAHRHQSQIQTDDMDVELAMDE